MDAEVSGARGGMTVRRVREMMRDGVPDRRIAKRLGLSERGLASVMDQIVQEAHLDTSERVGAIAQELGIVER